PSTSTAKTTIHDTEMVISEPPWKAIVTFVPMEEVREYLTECVCASVLSAWNDAKDSELLLRLLNHVNQRFRFSYVLGNGPQARVADFDDSDEEEGDNTPDLLGMQHLKNIDMRATNQLLSRVLGDLREIGRRHGTGLRERLEAENASDERV